MLIGLEVVAFEPAQQYLGPEIAMAVAVVGAAAVCVLACILFLYGLGWFATPPGDEPTESANSEEITVERKFSKLSLSTVASSTLTAGEERRPSFIYHLPSNSLERVVGAGDLEQALPNGSKR
jgi:hypothetical protein